MVWNGSYIQGIGCERTITFTGYHYQSISQLSPQNIGHNRCISQEIKHRGRETWQKWERCEREYLDIPFFFYFPLLSFFLFFPLLLSFLILFYSLPPLLPLPPFGFKTGYIPPVNPNCLYESPILYEIQLKFRSNLFWAHLRLIVYKTLQSIHDQSA